MTDWTRREFLQQSVAAGGALGLGLHATPPAQAQAPADGYIDAHVHVWTPDLAKYPLAAGWKADQMKPASFTPAELMQHAKPVGVTRVTLIQMSFYGFDNSYMLDVMRGFPGTYSGVAVIDEDAKPTEEMRRLKKLGVRGFRIRPTRGVDQWLTTEGMQAMWKCGAEENLAMCCLVNPEALPSIDAMCRKHPETPVVIDHFARVGVTGEIRAADLEALVKLADHKRTHVKVSAFYALGKKTPPYDDLGPMVQKLLAAFGRERLMWATDCPYQVNPGHTYAASLALIKDRLEFLTPDDKSWLLKKTAERVFFT